MRSSTVNLVSSFSRKTRGEETEWCISAPLVLSKYRQALSVSNCDGCYVAFGNDNISCCLRWHDEEFGGHISLFPFL
jgi:hypothetical protein